MRRSPATTTDRRLPARERPSFDAFAAEFLSAAARRRPLMPSHISTAYEIRPAQPRGKCQKSQEVVDQSCRPFERSRAITPYGMSPHKAQGRVSTCTLPRNKPTKYDFNVAFDEAEAKAVSPSPELARASVPVRLFSRRPGLLSAALQVERSLASGETCRRERWRSEHGTVSSQAAPPPLRLLSQGSFAGAYRISLQDPAGKAGRGDQPISGRYLPNPAAGAR